LPKFLLFRQPRFSGINVAVRAELLPSGQITLLQEAAPPPASCTRQWYENHADDFFPAPEELRQKLIQAAQQSAKKTERMNIRMTTQDMENLKLAAAREGLPYQSLVTSILHKYTSGLLVDVREARKLLSR
jgi:hypothetical protein